MIGSKCFFKILLFSLVLLFSIPLSAEPWRLSPQFMLVYDAVRILDKTGLDIDYDSDGRDKLFDIELSANSPLFWSQPRVIRHTLRGSTAEYGGLDYVHYETGVNVALLGASLAKSSDPLGLYIGVNVGLLKAESWFEKKSFKTGAVKIGFEGRKDLKRVSGVAYGLELHQSWSEAKPFNSLSQTINTAGLSLKFGLRF